MATITRLREHTERYDSVIREDVRPGEAPSTRWARVQHAARRKHVAKRLIALRASNWWGG